jgi:hypothetical protein
MRWAFRVGSLAGVLVAFALGGAAAASPPEVGHFSGVDTFGPDVVTDLPCLEGTAFIGTSSEIFRGTFVNSEEFFHFSGTNRFSGTLVPVSGEGPTYVEGGNVEKINFTARAVAAGERINSTNIINDQFIGYVDGKRVSTATIRIHEVEHFVGVDTNGDNIPEFFKVSVTIDRVSCPGS